MYYSPAIYDVLMRLDWLVGRAKVDVLLPKRSFDERTFRYRDKSVASATTFSQHTVIIRAKATNVTYVIWNCTPQIAIFVWLVSHINWQIQSIVTMSTTTPRHCSGLLPDRPAGSRGHVQTFSVASSRTVITCYCRIYLTITKSHTNCAHDPTPWL